MIGSHNTMTYLQPKKWWQKLIRFTARCQDKDIIEQYNRGARVFDIRINYDDFTYSHGLVDYINDTIFMYLTPAIKYLPDDIYYRIILEKGNKDKFKEFILDAIEYNQVQTDKIIYIVDDKKTWHIMWRNKKLKFKEKNHHAEYPKDGLLPNPKRHNKKYTPLTEEQINDKKTIYWIDFI